MLPPDPNTQMKSLSSSPLVHALPLTVTMTESVSETSESAMLYGQRASRNSRLLGGEHITSHFGSTFSAAHVLQYASPENGAGNSERLRPVSAIPHPMTEKEWLMAVEANRVQHQQVVLHVDAYDILGAPPVYKVRTGVQRGNSAFTIGS